MIPTQDVSEGASICRIAADGLLATSNDQVGRAGSDLRRACGDMKANAEVYIVKNAIAGKLNDCFVQARITGATMDELNRLREQFVATAAVSLLATEIKNACIGFCLQQISMVLAGTVFTSRDDVERIRPELNIAFDSAEEVAADGMVLDVYKSTVTLHAAVSFHLYETARPLPQMLTFQFSAPRPTLVLSHRLYDIAARADELRDENKVVHPAFAPRSGRALAF